MLPEEKDYCKIKARCQFLEQKKQNNKNVKEIKLQNRAEYQYLEQKK